MVRFGHAPSPMKLETGTGFEQFPTPETEHPPIDPSRCQIKAEGRFLTCFNYLLVLIVQFFCQRSILPWCPVTIPSYLFQHTTIGIAI